MLRLLGIIILLLNIYAVQAQDTLNINRSKTQRTHIFSLGAGSLGYRNSYFMPGGQTGFNSSAQYEYSSRHPKSFYVASARFDLALLNNNSGESSLNYTTHLSVLDVGFEHYFRILHLQKLNVYTGYNVFFHGDLSYNYHLSNDDPYHMPAFGLWFISTGAGLAADYALPKFRFELRSMASLFTYGFFLDYQNHPTSEPISYFLKHTSTAGPNHNFNFTNYLRLVYTGIKVPVFLQYSLNGQWTDVNDNMQKYRKNTFYIGIILGK
jgi:hypothetical protein